MRENFDYAKDYLMNEDGDIIQTIIVVAAFALLAIGAIAILSPAISKKTNEAADYIQQSAEAIE